MDCLVSQSPAWANVRPQEALELFAQYLREVVFEVHLRDRIDYGECFRPVAHAKSDPHTCRLAAKALRCLVDSTGALFLTV